MYRDDAKAARERSKRPLVDLLREKAELLGDENRLILTGYGNFGEHHRQMHSLLGELKIPHEYRDGPQRKHDWHSGCNQRPINQRWLDQAEGR